MVKTTSTPVPTTEPKQLFYLIVTHRQTAKGNIVHSQVMAESETGAAEQIGFRRRNYSAPEFTTVAIDGLTRAEAHAMSTPGINLHSLALAEHLGRVQDAVEAAAAGRMREIASRKAAA